jgi:hypothetical protein
MKIRPLELFLFAVLVLVFFTTTLAGAEIVQKAGVRIHVSGELSPQRLPRDGVAPIAVSVGGQITATDKSAAPRLKTLQIELNRNGRLDYAGLPTCPYAAIQTASSARALSACRSALVGRGTFSAEITLAGQAPYSISGRLLAFNGFSKGKPALFGQIYSPKPFATSFVIVFAIKQLGKGTFGTAFSAQLPKSLRTWGNLTGIELRLSRQYVYRGRRHSYLSAGCPALKGFPGASFPLARASFGFDKGEELSSTLTRNCMARG